MHQIHKTGAEKYCSNKIQSNAYYMRKFGPLESVECSEFTKLVLTSIIVTRSSQMLTT